MLREKQKKLPEDFQANPRSQYSREVDALAQDIGTWYGRTFVFIRKTRVKTWKGVFILAFVAGAAAAVIWTVSVNIQSLSRAQEGSRSPLMKTIKEKGCVADGIFSGYGGDTDNLIRMIENSNCIYLHRSIETWLVPPDFDQVRKNISKLENPDRYIIGMFLAEAIDPRVVYKPEKKKSFVFSKMCKNGSAGFWGENSCKANFESEEYRNYLTYITEKAVDAGARSFLFGQIFFQDNGVGNKSRAGEIVAGMRKYAASKGKEIIVGAQTNNIEDEKYLKIFDFIEGGVGLSEKGEIEDGPCFSRWWKKEGDRCWALLWHKKFSSQANDVILHLDWSGFYDDDMSTFARLDKQTREKTMERLYKYFTSKNMGFMLPYLAVINENNGSCYGSAKNFYAPANAYSCRDEDAFRTITREVLPQDALFAEQSVPEKMKAGKIYLVSVSFKNTGKESWSREKGFLLEAIDSENNETWGNPVELKPGESVGPGETKKFDFAVTAPEKSGEYSFQWRMLWKNNLWFGEPTGKLNVTVEAEEPVTAKKQESDIRKAEDTEQKTMPDVPAGENVSPEAGTKPELSTP